MKVADRIIKAIMGLLLFISFLSIYTMGIFLGLNKLAQKDNINKIVDTCVHSVTYEELEQVSKETSDNPDSSNLEIEGYDSLGDINEIFNQIAGGNIDLQALLNGLNNFNNIDSLGGIDSGLGDITSVASLVSGFKSSETIFDFFLRFIGAKDLFTKDMVKKACKGLEIDDINIDYFMKSNLSNHMVVELCYLYYDYISDKSVINTWDKDSEEIISSVIEDNEKDFAIILNKKYSDIDSETLNTLKTKLKSTTLEMMPSPQDKVNSMSKVVKLIIGFVFTNILVKFCIGIIALFFILSIVYHKNFIKASMIYGTITLIGGALIYLTGLLLQNFISKKLPEEKLSMFTTSQGFTYTGIIMLGIGITVLIISLILNKVFSHKSRTKGVKTTSVDVPDSETLTVMSSLGMFNNSFGDLKGENKIVDYYGDGRGLKEQKEWQSEHKQNNSNDSNNNN